MSAAAGDGRFEIRVDDEAGTRRLAADLAMVVTAGDVVALHGDLGMGKSAFARALLRALAGDPDLEVPSPTFTLAQTYGLPAIAATHFDLYRLADPGELDEIGFEEAMADGLVLIEWPERAGDRLPERRLDIAILAGDGPEARRFVLSTADAAFAARIARTLAVRTLLDRAGLAGAVRAHVHGDASTRSFERANAGGRSAIAMVWPAWRTFMRRDDGDRYEDVVHLTDDPAAYVAIADGLRRAGFRAPRVLAEDAANRLMLVEDLGAGAIVRDGVPLADRYLAAAIRIADLAAVRWPEVLVADDGRRHRLPAYDRAALATEAGLFARWYAPGLLGRPLTDAETADAAAIWDRLLARFDTQRSVMVLRDYHSPNILWQDDGDPIGLIDFQDALRGPAAYDVASLVTDARVDIPAGLAEAMLAAYAARRREADPAFDAAAFADEVTILSAQRNAKILGRFTEYAARTGRTAHLRFVPRVRGNLEAALAKPVLADLKLWYERLDPAAGSARRD